jgi:hypothetical protein
MNEQAPEQKRSRRPAGVTWLVLLVFILALAHLLSIVDIFRRWDLYRTLETSLPVWALAGLGGVWLAVWSMLGGGLWTCREWARRGTLVAVPLYGVLAIGQTLLFARSLYAHERLPFAAGLAVIASLVVILLLTRPGIKRVFGRHE